ncbi:salivary glue protein Sgs-3-like [Mizuhopecten yessoensis]|uniref:salivary glue protein Sgs-3-like n=1 Tax=Mizuhopecten yessoensis TaxID=6573 RepID=UPI000B45A98A|nr:salivary glue protein Sgs-3-like [Mizuhopecten yessoensis]
MAANFDLVWLDDDNDSMSSEGDTDLLAAISLLDTCTGTDEPVIDTSEQVESLQIPSESDSTTVTADDTCAEPEVSQKTARFPHMDEDELDNLVAQSASKHTDKMTKWGVNTFKCRNDSHQTPRPPTRPTITDVQTDPLNETSQPPTRPTITDVQTDPLNEKSQPPTRPTITDAQTDPLTETSRPPTRPTITDVQTDPLNETSRPPTRPTITDVHTDPLNETSQPPTRPTITDVQTDQELFI